MSSKLTLPAIALVVFGGLAGASAGFAHNPPSATPTPAPQGQGMMGGTGDMNNTMNMMGQMTKMMDNCNRMMESANQKPAAPATPPGQKG